MVLLYLYILGTKCGEDSQELVFSPPGRYGVHSTDVHNTVIQQYDVKIFIYKFL
jgi:hypothetical protein